ncbi:MAG: hypothetical protein ABFD91_12015 [Anaerohalosphaeraceae bacterium]
MTQSVTPMINETETTTEPNMPPETRAETGPMKNSKDYGTKIDKFIRTVKNGQKIKPADFNDPLDALLFGLISEHTTEKHARKVYKNLLAHFVDFNDLRVCRVEEIQEILEDFTPVGEQVAESLTRLLTTLFDKYDTLSLKGIDEQGKRQAKKELEELGGATRFAINYCFLAAFGGHAIPLNEAMLNYLRSEELVDTEATSEEVEGFLERHISASAGWEFHELLRMATEGGLKKASVSVAKTEKKKIPAKKKK